MTTSARRAAVLGHPVAHSLSPVLHRAAYRALGLADWTYEAFEVESEGLADFVTRLDGSWAGLSLTMPLKQTVLGLVDHTEPLAEVVGAVNTVLVAPARDGAVTLTGANTDVYGIVAAVREAAAGAGRTLPAAPTAAVIGSGATAASALAALGELGCSAPHVHVRSMARVGPLMRAAHRMGVEPQFTVLDGTAPCLATADIVISTVPAHAADEIAVDLGGTDGGILLDVVYDPRPTDLMRAWRAAGGVAVGGERMLLHQAAEQVRLMTGRTAPLEAMDAALGKALTGRVRA